MIWPKRKSWPVKPGDEFPLIMIKQYGGLLLYLEVAGVNRLTNSRDPKSGMSLRFPPLETATTWRRTVFNAL